MRINCDESTESALVSSKPGIQKYVRAQAGRLFQPFLNFEGIIKLGLTNTAGLQSLCQVVMIIQVIYPGINQFQ